MTLTNKSLRIKPFNGDTYARPPSTKNEKTKHQSNPVTFPLTAKHHFSSTTHDQTATLLVAVISIAEAGMEPIGLY